MVRIDPGRPDQNSFHVRMRRDISVEVQAAAGGDPDSQRAALAAWREGYNQVRPREALSYRTPADVYMPSTGRFEGTPHQLAHSDAFTERKVRNCGGISFEKSYEFIPMALREWDVGLPKRQDGHVGVWFAALRLGAID